MRTTQTPLRVGITVGAANGVSRFAVANGRLKEHKESPSGKVQRKHAPQLCDSVGPQSHYILLHNA